MLILPHLPAPTAVHDPVHGPATRAARTAAQRIGAHDPVTSYSARVRRDFSRSELGEPVDRSDEEAKGRRPRFAETPDILGHGATSLFTAQRYAQEEDPAVRPAVSHEAGTGAYPSLAFDDDILLPGEAIPLGWHGTPRLDITV